MIETLGVEFEFEVRKNYRDDEDEPQCGHPGEDSDAPCNICSEDWFCGHFDCPSGNYSEFYEPPTDYNRSDGSPIGADRCPWAVTRPWSSFGSSDVRRFCQYCRHEHDSDCYGDSDRPRYPPRSLYNSQQYLDDSISVTPLPSDWEIKSDGSLNSGFEICTPVLRLSEWPMDNVYKLFDRVLAGMRRWGCRAHQTCGVHVHIGYPELRRFELSKFQRRLLGTACNNEDILYHLAVGIATNHRGTSYCNPVSQDTATQIWYTKPGHASFSSDKYYGLNLRSSHGTVEFRYFNGTTQPDVAMSYVHLALGMMNFGLRSNNIMRPCLTAHEFISRLGIPKGEWHYFDSYFDLKEDKHKCKAERNKFILRPGPTGIRSEEKLTKLLKEVAPPYERIQAYETDRIPVRGIIRESIVPARPPRIDWSVAVDEQLPVELPTDADLEIYIQSHMDYITGADRDNGLPCNCNACTRARQYLQERGRYPCVE